MKIKNIIMAFLLVIALVFIPNVYAEEDIVIKSVSMEDSSTNAIFDQEPEIDGLKILFDGITFKDTGDFVRYRVSIENNSNEDYEINNGTSFSESEYFKYEFEFVGDNNIVNKKSSKDMFIKISYNKEVPATAFDDAGTFRETNEMVINLTNTVSNPKTGSGIAIILVFGLIVMIGSISVILINKTKLNKTLVMMIALALAIVPVTIYAAKMVTINLDTEIGIDKNFHFYLVYPGVSCDLGPKEKSVDAELFEVEEGPSCIDGNLGQKVIMDSGNKTFDQFLTETEAPENIIDYLYNDYNLTSKVKASDKIKNGGYYYMEALGR